MSGLTVLRSAHGIPGTPAIGCARGRGRGGRPAALPARGGCARAGKEDSFISRSRVSLSERNGGTKRKQGTEVLSGPVHSIARHKWQPKVGRERDGDRDPKGEPARRSDLSPLYRDRSRIAFIRGYIAKAIRMARFIS